MSQKYYKTEYRVIVLSEEPYNETKMDKIHYDIMYGECSGKLTQVSTEEVSEDEMAMLLMEQGSDPGFFGIDYKEEY